MLSLYLNLLSLLNPLSRRHFLSLSYTVLNPIQLNHNNDQFDYSYKINKKTRNPIINDDDSDTTNTLIHTQNNNIYFVGPVTPESCFILQQKIQSIVLFLKNQKDNSTSISPVINLYIQSMGGSLLPTFGLVDYMRICPIPIHTYVFGYVASAASIISVSGQARFMSKNSMMLIHSLRTGIGEVNYNQLEEHYLNSKSMMDNIKNIYKDKSIIQDEKLDFLLSHDYWLNSTECLNYKLIDYII